MRDKRVNVALRHFHPLGRADETAISFRIVIDLVPRGFHLPEPVARRPSRAVSSWIQVQPDHITGRPSRASETLVAMQADPNLPMAPSFHDDVRMRVDGRVNEN